MAGVCGETPRLCDVSTTVRRVSTSEGALYHPTRLYHRGGAALQRRVAGAMRGRLPAPVVVFARSVKKASTGAEAQIFGHADAALKRRSSTVVQAVSQCPAGLSRTLFSPNRLIIRRKLHNFFLNRPHHQLRLVVNSQLAHQIKLVRIHGFYTQPQNVGR